MNHVEMFKRFQRLQGGTGEVPTTEQIRALADQYEEAIAQLKWEESLNAAMDRRAEEGKLPDQYHEYNPREVPVRRYHGQRYFDPGSLGEYPIMAQGGMGEVRGKEAPFAEGGKWWWERADTDEEYNKALEEHEMLLDQVNAGLSQAEIDFIHSGVPPEKWPQSLVDKIYEGGRVDEGDVKPQHYAEGTGNVSLNYDPSYPGPVNPKGGGSGVPTQQWAGRGIGTASNFLFPGLGLLTGPLASWATRMLQSGLSQNQVQRAVQNYQSGGGQSGDTTPAPVDDGSNVTAPTSNAPPSAGIGIDPFGNPADPGEFWSSDFGRWGEGDAHGTTPGNYNPSGPGGISGTRGVWGGQTTIPISSDPNFTPSLGWAMPAASGGGAYGGNTMAKIAMHGTFKDVATPEQWAFMQDYLQGGQGGGGSGAGVGGAGRPMTQSRQMGTSDVNPGLKLFHAKQKRKK